MTLASTSMSLPWCIHGIVMGNHGVVMGDHRVVMGYHGIDMTTVGIAMVGHVIAVALP